MSSLQRNDPEQANALQRRNHKYYEVWSGSGEQQPDLYDSLDIGYGQVAAGYIYKDEVEIVGATGSFVTPNSPVAVSRYPIISADSVSPSFIERFSNNGVLGLGCLPHATGERPQLPFLDMMEPSPGIWAIGVAFKKGGVGTFGIGNIDSGTMKKGCQVIYAFADTTRGAWQIDVGPYPFRAKRHTFGVTEDIGPVIVTTGILFIHLGSFLVAKYYRFQGARRYSGYYMFPCEQALTKLRPIELIFKKRSIVIPAEDMNYGPYPELYDEDGRQMCLSTLQTNDLTGGTSFLGQPFHWSHYIIYNLSTEWPQLRIASRP